MTRKNFTDPDDLVGGLDDLAPGPEGGGARPRAGRGKQFTDVPPQDARAIAVATADRSMAGQYKRKQILIPPGQLAFIRDKARELGVSQAELFRWLIDHGLSALDEGVKPEIEIVDVRGETKKSHWTSH